MDALADDEAQDQRTAIQVLLEQIKTRNLYSGAAFKKKFTEPLLARLIADNVIDKTQRNLLNEYMSRKIKVFNADQIELREYIVLEYILRKIPGVADLDVTKLNIELATLQLTLLDDLESLVSSDTSYLLIKGPFAKFVAQKGQVVTSPPAAIETKDFEPRSYVETEVVKIKKSDENRIIGAVVNYLADHGVDLLNRKGKCKTLLATEVAVEGTELKTSVIGHAIVQYVLNKLAAELKDAATYQEKVPLILVTIIDN
ncbi:MAG: hypothetical protein H6765_05990 [Candidatus Peribacteria bacterium]|nr:MAG: hypothetical protein H6765_05990 [Candidatus Peribacteria bacterium]